MTDRFETRGLTFADSQERVVARVGRFEVGERTAVFEDDALRRTVVERLGPAGDQPWRFAFHSQISFSPPLPRGIGPVAVWPIVVRETCRAFANDLRTRGVRILRREPGHRTRADDGHQIHVERTIGELSIPGVAARVGVEGWVGLGRREGQYHVVGGAFPTAGLPVGVSINPDSYRRDLRELIQEIA